MSSMLTMVVVLLSLALVAFIVALAWVSFGKRKLRHRYERAHAKRKRRGKPWGS